MIGSIQVMPVITSKGNSCYVTMKEDDLKKKKELYFEMVKVMKLEK